MSLHDSGPTAGWTTKRSELTTARFLFGGFQRFHRANEFEGIDASLSIVQRIVQRQGGSIWAEAEVDARSLLKHLGAITREPMIAKLTLALQQAQAFINMPRSLMRFSTDGWYKSLMSLWPQPTPDPWKTNKQRGNNELTINWLALVGAGARFPS